MSVSSCWFDPQRTLLFVCPVFFRVVLFGAVWFHKRILLGSDIAGITLTAVRRII